MMCSTGDRIVVNPVRSLDGNSLTLGLESNDDCFGPSYKIDFRKPNEELVERLVYENPARVTNLTCAPCSMSVSIPDATDAIRPSELTKVWFGPSKFPYDIVNSKRTKLWF